MPGKQTTNSFGSMSDKYVQYNFHRREHVDQMLQVLQDKEGRLPRVVILPGEPGIGRNYFIESVAYIAGNNTHVCKLDLDGFANENTLLEEYVDHLISKAPESNRPRLRDVVKQVQPELKVKAGFGLYAFLSAALSMKVLVDKPRREANIDLSGPDRPPRERLSRLFSSLTKNARLIVHIIDNDLLTLTFRRWLLAELNTHKNLVLAFSCDSTNNVGGDFRGNEVLQLEFTPHDKKSCHSAIDRSFEPNSFPDAFYAAIWRYSHGVPRDIARVFEDLVREKQVRWSGDSWCVTAGDLTSEGFAKIFAAKFYEPFDALREELPAEQMDRLETFMRLAVMCGKYVPANLILEHMGLSVEERDAVCDLIDDRLIEKAEDPIFEDYEVSHPSFKGITIYGFKNRTLRKVFLQQLSSKEQGELASGLINCLRVNLPIRSRGIAKLFVELSGFVQRPRDIELYRNYLAWWVSTDDAQELSRHLVKECKNSQTAAEVLWHVVTATKHIWPPYRRLAVLEAYARQPGGVPFDMSEQFYNAKGILLRHTGRFREAEEIFRILLKRAEGSLGPYHPDTAAYLMNLAVTLCELGKYNEAEPLNRRALEIHDRVLGPDHPDTASSMCSLAGTLFNQGKYADGEALRRKALEIDEKVLGPGHLDTARSLHGLAGTLDAQAKYGEAEPLYRRALEIRERVLGPDHPDTASSLSGLARALHNQSKYDEAEPLSQRALEIRERILGPDHPHTATSLNNLGGTLRGLGKYDEAEAVDRRAFEIRERVLGPDHPDTAASLNNLALTLNELGRYNEAEPFQRRAVKIFEKVLGAGHRDTGLSLNNLVLTLNELGRHNEAEPLQRRAVEICEKALGPMHAETVVALCNLAVTLADQGKLNEAEGLYRRVVEIHEKTLGPDHSQTALGLANLGWTLRKQGKCDEAESRNRRALEIIKRVLGPDHPDAGRCSCGLARTLWAQGKYDEAEALQRRGLEILEDGLGPEHPEIARVLDHLAATLDDQNEQDEAEALRKRAQDIRGISGGKNTSEN